ncbi:MAG: pyridoxal phosphate-dependent decarboxylase family protein [Actinomycetota bacterium]
MIPLDPSPEQMRELGEAALAYAIDFLHRRPSAPASDLADAAAVARTYRELPQETGGEFKELLDLVEVAALKSYDNSGPGFLAYIPGGGLFASSLADLLATTTNRFVNLAMASPVTAQIEANVVWWLCDLFGFSEDARGVLTSGGSMANLSAVVTARSDRLGEDFSLGTVYVSEQAHLSVKKAAMIAGIPLANVRAVPVTRQLRMDVDALSDAIATDGAAGLRPFLVVASAGTTNTGAIDPLGDVAEVAEHEDVWFHVDAAYGGFFQLTERGRTRFAGIERADSITLDPHKGMFLPYGTGGLIVKDGAALRRAHHLGAAYLQDLPEDEEIPNFADYSPELSRDFRGLRVWFPLKLHGVGAFREALDETLDLAEVLADGLRTIPQIEVPWDVDLTVVPFRLRDGDDEANRRLLAEINASKRVALSSTVIDGRFVIRACILVHRTHRDRIDECIEIVRAAAARVAG